MDRKIGLRMCELISAREKDPEYQALLREYRMRDKELQASLKTMTEHQRSAVMDYGGIAAQLYIYLLEFACGALMELENEKTRE